MFLVRSSPSGGIQGHGDAALHRVHYQEGKFALANLLVALLPKDPNICDAKYPYLLLTAKKDEYFVPMMLGTANVSLKEKDIANVEIPLPSVEEQRRVVTRIEELAAKIQEARVLRKQATREAEKLIHSTVTKIDGKVRETRALTKLETFARREKGSLRSAPFGSALLHQEFVADGVPAIGIQDVLENRFGLSWKWNVTPEKAEALKRFTIPSAVTQNRPMRVT